jgi:hypothetical protein
VRATWRLTQRLPATGVRVRVEIMGSQKCRIVGESQSDLIMTHPMISEQVLAKKMRKYRAKLETPGLAHHKQQE